MPVLTSGCRSGVLITGSLIGSDLTASRRLVFLVAPSTSELPAWVSIDILDSRKEAEFTYGTLYQPRAFAIMLIQGPDDPSC
jgi:hypothetical protein